MDDYKNDIEKYLNGKLTPAEMHALEKKALSDPFLADALEGMGSLQPNEFEADMRQMQAELNKRLHQKNTAWTWTGRIAAGLLLLAISTVVIVFIAERREKPDNLALNKEEKIAPEQQAEQSVADSTNPDRVAAPATPQREAEQKTVSPGKTPEPRSRAQEPLAQAPEKNAEEILAEDEKTDGLANLEIPESTGERDDVARALPREKDVATGGPASSAPPVIKKEEENSAGKSRNDSDAEYSKRKAVGGVSAKDKASSYAVNRKIVRGKVTFSEDGTGLPGVNVLIKGTNEGTVTDPQGNYQIPVVDDGRPTLIFSSIGFSSKEVEATSDEWNVQLDADISELSEVVVVGHSTSDDVGFLPSTPTVMELATPEGGRKMFKQYLQENLRYPEQALKNQVEGKVTVQFAIGMTGQLSDFRVIRGLGFGCDEEVIRLIKDGPKWSPTKKNEAPVKDRARVRMRFALPKK